MDGEKRAHEYRLAETRWGGVFAQVAPKEHDKLLKALLRGDKPKPRMSGVEIGSAMRAWAKATQR